MNPHRHKPQYRQEGDAEEKQEYYSRSRKLNDLETHDRSTDKQYAMQYKSMAVNKCWAPNPYAKIDRTRNILPSTRRTHLTYPLEYMTE
eukprot:c31618_g1_i1 orf=3-266(-)